MMPNPRKSATLHRLHDTVQPCRVAPPVAGPETFGALGKPYDWMLPAAKKRWREIDRAMSAAGAPLTVVERSQLGLYCQMWARFAEAEAAGRSLPASWATTMNTIAGKLLDRSRMQVAPAVHDPLAELLGDAG
jgi:phage terminase small subunit